MSFTQLQYYLCVIESGSITQAAKRLYISQQALSKHIKELEKELGASLLERTVSGIKPTQYGAIVCRYARAALDNIKTMENEISSAKRREQNIVRLGIQIGSYSIYSALPTTVLSKFSEDNPHIELQTYVSDTRWIGYEQILDDEFDVVYTVELFHAAPLKQWRLLTRESVYVLMSASHRLAHNESIRQADLQDERFISPRVNPVPEHVFTAVFSNLVDMPDICYDADNINEAIELIRLNKGLFFSGKAFLLSLNLDGLVMRHFSDCGYQMEHVLYFRDDSPADGAVIKTVDWLYANCKNLN